ncbi:hypothetical protein GRI42_00020 [Erythrobacter gaetbuli]|uniref:Uncharacterized protein n=1 Tax=Qipengyuania gaetbuli TaxID=266952 RepID=A0A844XWF4_9SPHN|nr:hypothetical protein [Qipengyuania gaetbuli]MXO49689.1 hypothetical protein [Qipengyuania gaetbuli]
MPSLKLAAHFRETMRLLPILLVAFLAACTDQAPSADQPPAETHQTPALEWTKSPDGAMVAFYKNVSAYKCWPDGSDYDCLQAVDLHEPYEAHIQTAVSFSRGRVSKLPTEAFETLGPSSHAHYNCSIDDGTMTERITRNDRLLIEESTSFPTRYSSAWEAAFVKDFYSSNNLSGIEGYFNCPALGEALSSGSLETLNTNVIHRALLDFFPADPTDLMAE